MSEVNIARIGLFSNSSDFGKNVAASLSAVPHCEIHVNKSEDILFGLDNSNYDLIILDIGDGEILEDARLQTVRQRNRMLPLIVVSPPLSADQARAIVQLKADDWLQHPLADNTLLETVFNQLGGGRIARCEVYGFMGSIGSPGTTLLAMTVADLLAQEMAEKHGGEVCLIDLDFASGSCGAYLDVASDFDFDTIFTAPERIDLEMLEQICHKVSDRLEVFSIRRPDFLLVPNQAEFVLRLLDIASYRFGALVLDLPSYPTSWVAGIMAEVDRMVIVSETTIPCLRAARQRYDFVNGHRRSDKGVYVAVNREKPGFLSRELTRPDMKRVFGNEITAYLPEDRPTMTESLNQGVIPSRLHPRSRYTRGAKKLLAQLRRSS